MDRSDERSTEETPSSAETTAVALDHGRRRSLVALRFLRSHWGELGALYLGVIAPLLLFGWLARGITGGAGAPLPFDPPLMLWLREWTWGGAERASLLLADVGYRWGVVPFDVALVVLLLLAGRLRKGLFFAAAVGGSALLNMGAKALFERMRPDLWEHIVHETSYSFPSGHAMGSMTLTVALSVLAWDTRWRWWVLAPALLFAVAVSASRVWLGVHYPSDILAAWAAALAWTLGVAHFFRMRRRTPPEPGGQPPAR